MVSGYGLFCIILLAYFLHDTCSNFAAFFVSVHYSHVFDDGTDEYKIIMLNKRYLSFRIIKVCFHRSMAMIKLTCKIYVDLN